MQGILGWATGVDQGNGCTAAAPSSSAADRNVVLEAKKILAIASKTSGKRPPSRERVIGFVVSDACSSLLHSSRKALAVMATVGFGAKRGHNRRAAAP